MPFFLPHVEGPLQAETEISDSPKSGTYASGLHTHILKFCLPEIISKTKSKSGISQEKCKLQSSWSQQTRRLQPKVWNIFNQFTVLTLCSFIK